MSNSTRMIGLIIAAALWARIAAAQVPPTGSWDDSTPPTLSMPLTPNSNRADGTWGGSGDSSQLMQPGANTPGQAEEYGLEQSQEFGPGTDAFWHNPPAEIESTTTWLRRGFWYAEAEAVIYNRFWRRKDIVFAVEPVPANPTSTTSQQLLTNRDLLISSAKPGEDAAVRGTLAHFLFRDSNNRDHLVEFTAFGGGDWEQHREIGAINQFGLQVPEVIDGNGFISDGSGNLIKVGNRSFDNSNRQVIDYASHFHDFELNYRVMGRPTRDQLIMDANGCWHRAGNSRFVSDYLIGLRFMDASDFFDWRAFDVEALGNNGQYLIRTENDMFGLQLGRSLDWETPRWSLGIFVKGGVYIDDALGLSDLTFTGTNPADTHLRLRENNLAWVAESKLLARYHLTPNFSLRASYEIMALTSQALAPVQANFITDQSFLNTSRDVLFHGASFGLEGYW